MSDVTRSISTSSHASGGSSQLSARRSDGLRGSLRPPGDKSISHRALILGLLARGRTEITGLLEGDDVLRTADACRALGAQLDRQRPGAWSVEGVGLGNVRQPSSVLDFGNAGTGTRLMMGAVGGHPLEAAFDGDASLRRRPMRRILDPLQLMGVEVVKQTGEGRCPIVLRGAESPHPIEYWTPVASAQIKSAVLLAGLTSKGRTVIVESEASRDHTEKMLTHFGAAVVSERHGEHGRRITLEGRPNLVAAPVSVPADPSSAAFGMVAALIVPNSSIVVEGVMMNPLRTGLLTTLREMGGRIEIGRMRPAGGESVADLEVRSSGLIGIDVPAARAPSMIDEYPILAVAAAFAQGTTRMRGLQELRVKESDRLAAIVAGLASAGVRCAIDGDDLLVEGNPRVQGGATVETHLDHRIAMSFLVMGLATCAPMTIDDDRMIATSFPGFRQTLEALGADFA